MPAIAVTLVRRGHDLTHTSLLVNGTPTRPAEYWKFPETARVLSINCDWNRRSLTMLVEDPSFDVVPEGDMPPDMFGELATGNPITVAVGTLEVAIREDELYRKVWLANIATAAIDEGVASDVAEKIAVRFVRHFAPTWKPASTEPNG